MNRTVTALPSALALCVLAGTALGQTWNGGGLVSLNSDWNNAANWTALPPAGGGAAVQLVFGPVANPARLVTNMNHGNPFNLQLITFAANAGGAYSITSTPAAAPLRFNGVNAGIFNQTNDVTHVINSPIVLNANIGILGAADSVNSRSQLDLTGSITEAAAGLGITIRMERNTDVILSGNNRGAAGFSGNLTHTGGVLVLDNNNAAGRGTVVLQRFVPGQGQNPVLTLAMRASNGNTIVYPNGTNILSDVAFGSANSNSGSVLATTGTVSINGSRTVSLVGGRNHTTEWRGDIALGAANALVLRGDVAPTLDGNLRIVDTAMSPKKGNLGSVMVWSGAITQLQGTVGLVDCTLRIDGSISTALAPSTANFVVGNGNTACTVIGRAQAAGARVAANVPRLHFANGAGMNFKKKAVWAPGASPGIMAVNGGSVFMEPGSGFSVTLNGTAAGNGDGYYGQAMLENGCTMTLDASPLGERPILGIALQTWDSTTLATNFTPSLGMQFTIIDQDVSSAPSLYSPEDLSQGLYGNMFMAATGTALTQGAHFYNENLPLGLAFQIDYFGGDTGNDVVLTIVPTPGAGSVLALSGLAVLRRKRR